MLPEPGDLLYPAKHLLDSLAGGDRLGIALMEGGAAVDGGAATKSLVS